MKPLVILFLILFKKKNLNKDKNCWYIKDTLNSLLSSTYISKEQTI